MIDSSRRRFLGFAASAGMAAPWASHAQSGRLRVVVVGAGFGGATAAKYLRRFDPSIQVTLIEPASSFVMCPMSNRVIHGGMTLREITRAYEPFVNRHGLRWVRAAADEIDPDRREVRVGRERFAYDRLIVAPGVDFSYEELPGMESSAAQSRIPHAWKAGVQTQQLKDMIFGMADGGVVAIHMPKVPYRCPPGPYERASLIAFYLKLRKPKSKLLLFDSNPEIQSKKGLFESVWAQNYKGLVEYVPNAEIERVDAAQNTLEFKLHGKVRADVINLIPPQRAGAIARNAGLANVGNRWCGVDFLNYASTAHKDIYVVGDSVAAAPGMPKSGHMANQQAKVCAGAIAAQSLGLPIPNDPIIANTCYSFVSQTEVIHVAAVYRYDKEKKTMVAATGAGGLSPAPSQSEAVYAMAWAANILNDTLG